MVKLFLKERAYPVETLFGHLKAGYSIDYFLDDFPTVTKGQASGLLELVSQFLSSTNIETLISLDASLES